MPGLSKSANGRVALRKVIAEIHRKDAEVLRIWLRQPLSREDGRRLGALRRRTAVLRARINRILCAALTRAGLTG